MFADSAVLSGFSLCSNDAAAVWDVFCALVKTSFRELSWTWVINIADRFDGCRGGLGSKTGRDKRSALPDEAARRCLSDSAHMIY